MNQKSVTPEPITHYLVYFNGLSKDSEIAYGNMIIPISVKSPYPNFEFIQKEASKNGFQKAVIANLTPMSAAQFECFTRKTKT